MNSRQVLDQLTYAWQRLAQPIRFAGLEPPHGGWPAILGVSFPKSGTNLLIQALSAFTTIGPFSDRSHDVFAVYEAVTGKRLGPADALRFLGGLRPGDIASAHFFAWPEVVDAVCTPRYLPFFISRDPRDVVVSHVFYVTEKATEHVHHEYYARVLDNFDDRLTTSILGRPEVEVEFVDIGRRYEPYLGWLDREEVLALRFEDFIHQRQCALERMARHFLRRVDSVRLSPVEIAAVLERNIVPERSRTFRSGKTGEWRKYFKEEHKRLFKEVAGDLLIRLGYEQSHDW